jgi:tetratricopeptide (TPR) repeat protein
MFQLAVLALLIDLAHKPVPLRAGIGSAHDAVTTSSKQAQAFYDQGLAYIHSYVWLEAARSFNQALTIDPNLAIAYAGLSLAYTELNDPAAARAALARAKALAPKAAERERLWIEARALQMDAEAAPADPAKLTAYRAALDRALQKYPSSEELWLARGKAESRDPADRGQGSTAASAAFYQKALALAPAHFAAHHFLAHTYENTGRPREALTEAAAYARMAPNIPHARHMHGHELRRVGRVDEAIAEFRAADALDSAYMKAEGIPAEHDWHYQHNLDLLATSYQYVGRMNDAEALFKQSFAIPSTMLEQEFNKREWPVFLLARGRAEEALAAANTLAAHPSPLVKATGRIEAGEAHLAVKQYAAAADDYNAALRLMRGAEGGGLLAAALRQLNGELLLRTGQQDKGRAALEQTVKDVRGRPGPDEWIQATFTIEAIARTARDVGDWTLAAWAARQLIDHDPNYAGAHRALALVAEHNGDEDTARDEFDRARTLWSKADPGLPELRR